MEIQNQVFDNDVLMNEFFSRGCAFGDKKYKIINIETLKSTIIKEVYLHRQDRWGEDIEIVKTQLKVWYYEETVSI